MKLTEKEAIKIAEAYSLKYKLGGKIKSAQFNRQFDVEGREAWIVKSEDELFGEVKEYFYVISDKTGNVEYTMTEHGIQTPHLRKEVDD